jgi:hypothetical protein
VIKNLSILTLSFWFLLAIGALHKSNADIITLIPLDDTSADFQESQRNWGSASVLSVSVEYNPQHGVYIKDRSYLKFDLSQIPDSAINSSYQRFPLTFVCTLLSPVSLFV